MTEEMGDRLGTRIPWLSLLFAALLVLLASNPYAEPWAQTLGWQRMDQAAWQLWSCSLVHFGPLHAVGDAVGLLIGGYWVERRLGPWRLALAWVIVAPLAVLSVAWLQPDVGQVRGASALSVFGLVAAWAGCWLDATVSRRWLFWAALLFVVKMLGDAFEWRGSSGVLPHSVGVAWPAHACAAGCALVWRWTYRRAPLGSSECKSLANATHSH
jgi:membrane associated rhomboid family serine protease